ncbi:hypothetical protein ACB092_01G304900 [Castanea dentata]
MSPTHVGLHLTKMLDKYSIFLPSQGYSCESVKLKFFSRKRSRKSIFASENVLCDYSASFLEVVPICINFSLCLDTHAYPTYRVIASN